MYPGIKLFTQSEVTVVGTIENINMIYSWFMVSRYLQSRMGDRHE